jgi:hypothetical protein
VVEAAGHFHTVPAIAVPVGGMFGPRQQTLCDLRDIIGSGDQRGKLAFGKGGKGSNNRRKMSVHRRHFVAAAKWTTPVSPARAPHRRYGFER